MSDNRHNATAIAIKQFHRGQNTVHLHISESQYNNIANHFIRVE